MDIRTTCLGVLALGPASGYEIRKAFEEGPFSHFAEGGFGSIYPALGKLSDGGFVTCTTEQQAKRPDKKIYQITDAGLDALFGALGGTTPGEDKYKSNLLFILFFAQHMPPDHIASVIDTRLDWYRGKLDHLMEDAGAAHEPPATGADLVREFGVAVYQAAYDFMRDNREAFIALARDNARTTESARRIETHVAAE
ncbi:MAG: PadR family transcriptional regulator [Alphaproteobacteria bacterium]|nr:PadR family transcriptional regulator [Alphaproteobacteria bacterium]